MDMSKFCDIRKINSHINSIFKLELCISKPNWMLFNAYILI